MKISFRFPDELFQAIQSDLSRKHKFAGERVGFVECSSGATEGGGLILLAESYHSVADEHYINDPRSGATINSAAFRTVLQRAYGRQISIFHVHRHEHYGVPKFSEIDIRESYKFVPDFFKVQRSRSHGVLVLSHDSAYGLCWNPGEGLPVPIREFGLIGRPVVTVRHEDHE
jgi:hypothetical protein